jgi:hypothetical protein
MKQPRVIQRLSSLMLASLLLFTAVWGPGSLVHERTLLANKASHPGSNAAESAPKATKPVKATDSHEAQLSTAQFEAVVTPAIQIGGSSQTAFLLPAPTLLILLLLSVPLLRHFTLPHYFFSYFQHVFGHAIAPNAP